MKSIDEKFEDWFSRTVLAMNHVDRHKLQISQASFKAGYEIAKREYDVVAYDLKHNTQKEKDAYFETLKNNYSEEFAYFMKDKFVMLHPDVMEFAFHLWAETKETTKREYEDKLDYERVIERAYLIECNTLLERSSEATHYNWLDDKINEVESRLKEAIKVIKFYGNWANSQYGKLVDGDCELMQVIEPLDKDKNGVVIGGKKAREFLKSLEDSK